MHTKRTTFRRIGALLLLITMLLSNTTGMAFAQLSGSVRENRELGATIINPKDAYPGLELPTGGFAADTMADPQTFNSFEEAGVYLRDQMELRKTTISFSVKGYSAADNEALRADADRLLDIAFTHTGVPTEGDYLKFHVSSYDVSFNGTFTFTMSYLTSAKQETEMNTAVEELVAGWESEHNINALSDYEKVNIIYDHICRNVTYSYSSKQIKYSAYAALINGSAVCQGYSSLFYRLALTLGVDARYISGTARGEAHGWNIVALDGSYYQLDATSDAERPVYIHFLRGADSTFRSGSDHFADHTPDEEYLSESFTARYPIAAKDFESPLEPIVFSGVCGSEENIEWTLTNRGVLKLSGSGKIPLYADSSLYPWGDYCIYIKSLTIGEGITTISQMAFYYFVSMTEVTIPASMTEIGLHAFTDCPQLKTVYFTGTQEQWDAIKIVTVDPMRPMLVSNGDLLDAELVFVKKGLAAPTLTVKLNADNKPVISWSKVDGAEKYQLYRAVGSGEYKLLTTTTGTKVTNNSVTAGTQYSYKVRAVAGDTKSTFSAVKSITVPSAIAAPTLTVTLNSSNKPAISWTAVAGAEKYELYGSVDGGEFKLLKTMTGTKIAHNSAVAGKTYSYKVRAVIGAEKGDFSAAKSITVPAALGAPTVTLSNNASSGKIVISWTAVAGAEKYEIWACTTKDGSYSKLGTVSGTSATHSSAKAGKTYYYKVRAIAGDVKGSASAAVGKTCDLARPTLTVKLNSKGKPALSWNAVEGAVKYEIWASTSKNGTYSKLGTVTGTGVAHSSAKSGVTYYYKIKAICSVSSGDSAFSAIKSVTAK